MIEAWRWFGPADPVGLGDVRQAGAAGIVTALHEIYTDDVWPVDLIARRKAEVEAAGFTWAVVESIPVHPSIKLGDADAARHTDRWIATMRNLAQEGMTTICYNFMPVVDWTRTDLRYPAPMGGLALRFDTVALAAYDIHVLRRAGAAGDYPADVAAAAEAHAARLGEAETAQLERTIIAGLPGKELSHDREAFRAAVATFAGMTADDLRANLVAFLGRIVPAAEEAGVRLCLHPDDPPIPLFGLPRVVSTQADYAHLFDAVPSLSNGITLCAGSLGSRADNDVAAIARAFAPRVHFAHLRNVARQEHGAFFESDHLDGDVDMVEVVALLLAEERRRKDEGRRDWQIPMRPDHGHLLLDDRDKATNPGYSAIGRLKGLAELRGVMRALEAAATRPGLI